MTVLKLRDHIETPDGLIVEIRRCEYWASPKGVDAVLDTIREETQSVLHHVKNPETTVNGYKVFTPDTTTTILAAVQVLSAQDMRSLPEGEDANEWRNIWHTDDVGFYRAQGIKVHDTLRNAVFGALNGVISGTTGSFIGSHP